MENRELRRPMRYSGTDVQRSFSARNGEERRPLRYRRRETGSTDRGNCGMSDSSQISQRLYCFFDLDNARGAAVRPDFPLCLSHGHGWAQYP